MRILMAAALAGLAILAIGAPARAQIGLPGGVPGLPSLPRTLPDRLPVDPNQLEEGVRGRIDGALQAPSRLRDLIRRSDGALEADPNGWPVVRAEIVAVDPSSAGRRAALDAGFTVLREERLEGLDLAVVVLAPPRGLSLRRAVERLRDLDPGGAYEFNHVHSPAGRVADEAAPPVPPTPESLAGPAPARSQAGGARIGLIDTGVDAGHPALAGATVRQRGFAGADRPGAHGTAVASLLAGRSGSFSGAAPGSTLFVADVYGGSPSGGSSTGVAQALSWMVQNDVPVVNVSLVGPRNALVETAVRRATGRGVLIVAAVGNDGPAAAPLYPASYPDVVGVTAVNAQGRALPEAARGPQVDFSAPGADMAAAGAGEGYVSVRGASFAAPLVAGLLARRRGRGDDAVQALAAEARDLGARGPDPVYGRGLVAADLRTAPAAVGARGRLSR
ncbi:S8 family serine peptidase [Brevundimonas sp.]|uniref:S8 family serine peptidase n=1 Tax=Brevundimonas sp. TaxID=1871086 RepID=UPI002D678245|nr:S8 family serine peptidase [Brevundimonas sp.]HYC97997.1 S8 family serine peptidase [Brevundimonas sp.]